MHSRFLISILVLSLSACAADATGTSSGALVVTDQCTVSGSGALDTGDTMSGEATGGTSGATGSWTHNGGDGQVVLGTADWILCRINGATLGDFGGAATLDGSDGYTFRVSVQDFGERSVQWDHGTPEVQTVSATRYYRPTSWEDGSVSIDARSLVTIPSELPVTVGGSARGWASLTFSLSETSETVTCRYRGNAVEHGDEGCHGDDDDGAEGGDLYVFDSCVTDDNDGDEDGGIDEGRDDDGAIDEGHDGDDHRDGDHDDGDHHHDDGDDHHDDGDHHHDDGGAGDSDDSTDDDSGMTVVTAGDEVDVTSMTLHVQNGDSRLPSRRDAQTTVAVDLNVTPLIRVESNSDYYRISVWDDATSEQVYLREGFLSSGDFVVDLLTP